MLQGDLRKCRNCIHRVGPECHRFPPQVTVKLTSGIGIGNFTSATAFPTVKMSDFCSEWWESRESQEERS